MKTFTQKTVFSILTSLSLIIGISALCHAKQIFVDQKATGLNDGTSWANAYTDLQVAIDNAEPSDDLWIAAGTYKPVDDGTRTGFVIQKYISLYGGFLGSETVLRQRTEDFASRTILTGDFLGNDTLQYPSSGFEIHNNEENAYHVLFIKPAVEMNTDVILNGLTIKGGNADFGGDVMKRRGGGIFSQLKRGSVKVQHCKVINNSANLTGGGIFMGALGYIPLIHENVRFQIEDSLIQRNLAAYPNFNDDHAVHGAGIAADYANLHILNSEISLNEAQIRKKYPRYSKSQGGGVYLNNSKTKIEKSLLRGNKSDFEGGAVWNRVGFLGFVNTIISNNTAKAGPALFNEVAVASFTNCDIVGNHFTEGEVDSSAIFHDAGLSEPGVRLSVRNSIFHLNSLIDPALHSENLIVSHNLMDSIPPVYQGNGNIEGDPKFIDAAPNDFRLPYNSPAVDAGTAAGAPATDFAGVERPKGPAIDIGAFEYNLNQEILPGWPKQVDAPGSASIGDVDGNPDNGLEVVVIDYDSNIHVWDYSGRPLDNWPKKSQSFFYGAAGALIQNIDGNLNNGAEILVTSYGRSGYTDVHAFNYLGNSLPGWPVEIPTARSSRPTVADLDGDGESDVLVTTSILMFAINANGTLHPEPSWPIYDGFGFGTDPAVADLDGDPTNGLEIVTNFQGPNRVSVYNKEGNKLIDLPTNNAPRLTPALGDIDGDGDKEIVSTTQAETESTCVPGPDPYCGGDACPVDYDLCQGGCNENEHCRSRYIFNVYAWHHNGDLVSNNWPVQVIMPSRYFIGSLWPSSPILADLDGDNKLEVIVQFPTGDLYIWDSKGNLLPGWPKSIGNWVSHPGAVADLDNDGQLEIIVEAAGESKVFAYNLDGSILKGWPIEITHNEALNGAIVIGDLDNNTRLDLVLTHSSYVSAFEIPYSDSTFDRAPWPMLHGNAQNTGTYQPPLVNVMKGLGKTRDQFISPLDQDLEFKEIEIKTSEPMEFPPTNVLLAKLHYNISVTPSGGFNRPAYGGVVPKNGATNTYIVKLLDRVPIQTDPEDPQAAWTTIELDVRSKATGIKNKLRLNVSHLPIDINQDRQVSMNDASAFVQHWGGNKPLELIDFNGDGQVNINDATLFGQLFNGTSGKARWNGVGLPPLPEQ